MFCKLVDQKWLLLDVFPLIASLKCCTTRIPLYLTDKDEMPNSNIFNQVKLLFQSMQSLSRVARQANKCLRLVLKFRHNITINNRQRNPPEGRTMVMIYHERKELGFFSINCSY